MFWARSQLFWKIAGLYVLLSLLALGGLVAALNAQLSQQAEDLHREEAQQLSEQLTRELAIAADPRAVCQRWRESMLLRGFRVWFVDGAGQPLWESSDPVPDRAIVQSAIRAAVRSGESIRWTRDEEGEQSELILARLVELPFAKPAVSLLVSDAAAVRKEHQLFASAAARGALFTWMIGVICMVFVALGLVGPLQILTENLGSGVAKLQRQDMLLRISDRRDELGDVANSLTLMEDEREERIQALQDAEFSLRSTVDLLTAVLESMVEGVIAIDEHERIVFLNSAARRLLGISDAIGVNHRLYEAVRIPAMLETVAESLTTQTVHSLEFRTTREGLSLTMVVSPFSKGGHSGAVAVVRDISELRRLDAMRRDFVSGVSHELKTPLTVIQACTDTLLDGALDDPDASRRFLRQIDEQSERLLKLILGMLQLARVESGAEAFRFEPIRLDEVADEVLTSLEPLAESRQLTLNRTGLSELTATADYQAVRTVISNLLDNAIKHTPQGGSVGLSLTCEDGSPVITVRDTGVGIAAEHLSRIFERFYRVDRDRSRERGGTGLGLAIVKHLCHTMKAAVSVSSIPGQGTEFRVVFRPAVSTKDAAAGTASAFH